MALCDHSQRSRLSPVRAEVLRDTWPRDIPETSGAAAQYDVPAAGPVARTRAGLTPALGRPIHPPHQQARRTVAAMEAAGSRPWQLRGTLPPRPVMNG